MNLIDSQKDVSLSFLLSKLTERPDLQELIVNMTVVDDLSNVPSDKFAYPELRKFPVDTMNNTLLSKVYFDLQKDEIPLSIRKNISDKLDAYIHLHAIPFDLFTRGYSAVKTASDPEITHTLLPDQGLFKIACAEDLTIAGDIFEEQYAALKLPVRVEFSRNFIKAARDYNLESYPAAVTKYASVVGINYAATEKLLEHRAAAAKRVGRTGNEYRELCTVIKEASDSGLDLSSDELTKLAEMVHSLDQKNKLTKFYGKTISDPYTVVFTGTNEAGKKQQSKTASSTYSDWTCKDIEKAFGKEAVEAFTDEDGKIDFVRLGHFINV